MSLTLDLDTPRMPTPNDIASWLAMHHPRLTGTSPETWIQNGVRWIQTIGGHLESDPHEAVQYLIRESDFLWRTMGPNVWNDAIETAIRHGHSDTLNVLLNAKIVAEQLADSPMSHPTLGRLLNAAATLPTEACFLTMWHHVSSSTPDEATKTNLFRNALMCLLQDAPLLPSEERIRRLHFFEDQGIAPISNDHAVEDAMLTAILSPDIAWSVEALTFLRPYASTRKLLSVPWVQSKVDRRSDTLYGALVLHAAESYEKWRVFLDYEDVQQVAKAVERSLDKIPDVAANHRLPWFKAQAEAHLQRYRSEKRHAQLEEGWTENPSSQPTARPRF
jgi:hypothetical protein